MKKLKRVILFLLVFAVLLWACSAGIQVIVRNVSGSVSGRSRVFASVSAEKKNTIDVLVAGDSESYTSVSPMDLWDRAGIAAYDCGQPGQRIQETYYILKTAFRTQSPKLVLFETNTMFRDPGFLKNVQLSLTEPLAYHFPVIKYHNAWKALFDGPGGLKKSYKGFEIRDKVVSYEGDEEYMKETKDKAQIPEVVRVYMEKIKRLCEKNGADLLLVSAPSPKNYNYKKHNSLEEYARENNLPYVDLNMKFRDIGIDWKQDSYDRGDHLNISGARKVTAYIGQYLADNYDLPDRRNDDGWREWDNLAREYLEEL
ncbi:MAG TPA: SGNH/GDSL hydrolase family protein [Candidatus Mediterraneibacter quadrami]|uniref:SGNH/GDSL hydrolase family protein n=1 Tax=Candidatus Mediterraneibacter quadrami TaxID=2838684 RepID=A0A9D2REC2_9FIRM|nr:SGNH/GDSL hydrolase family protein [Candidatus Mediterraneibacter quadrami]